MKILFLCVANSARSQMAEGLARHMLDENFVIESAGSDPSGVVHPDAITTMQEMGIDISKQHSKAITQLPAPFLQDLDYLITLCAEELCPNLPLSKAQKLHWGMPDPAAAKGEEERLNGFRAIRDKIKEKIKSQF